jgi:hypothetical protein
MPKIANRKTLTIAGILTQTNILKFDINVTFPVNEIILKSVSLFDTIANNNNNSDRIFLIKSSLVPDQTIYHYTLQYEQTGTGFTNFVYNTHTDPNITYQLLEPMCRGEHTFTITKIDGTKPTNTNTFGLRLALTLEFIQYE